MYQFPALNFTISLINELYSIEDIYKTLKMDKANKKISLLFLDENTPTKIIYLKNQFLKSLGILENEISKYYYGADINLRVTYFKKLINLKSLIESFEKDISFEVIYEKVDKEYQKEIEKRTVQFLNQQKSDLQSVEKYFEPYTGFLELMDKAGYNQKGKWIDNYKFYCIISDDIPDYYDTDKIEEYLDLLRLVSYKSKLLIFNYIELYEDSSKLIKQNISSSKDENLNSGNEFIGHGEKLIWNKDPIVFFYLFSTLLDQEFLVGGRSTSSRRKLSKLLFSYFQVYTKNGEQKEYELESFKKNLKPIDPNTIPAKDEVLYDRIVKLVKLLG